MYKVAHSQGELTIEERDLLWDSMLEIMNSNLDLYKSESKKFKPVGKLTESVKMKKAKNSMEQEVKTNYYYFIFILAIVIFLFVFVFIIIPGDQIC